jgi:hypothetical protein
MRQTSNVVCKAFIERKAKKVNNTHTDGKELMLFGNTIAWWDDEGNLLMTLAGWGTTTTRERLNTLCHMLKINGGFNQKNNVQFFNGVPIDSDQIIKIEMS